MVRIQEVFQLAVETDLIGSAHRIFWAVTQEKVKMQDHANELHVIEYDEEAIAEMIEQNILGIGSVKLYVAKTKTLGQYAFYYSENVMEAQLLHQQLFNETPQGFVNGNHLLGEVFQFDEAFTTSILYFHRTKIATYPYYLGHAWAGERVFYKLVG